MTSTNDNTQGINFKWIDERKKNLCELCIKFIRKNGCVTFKWNHINQESEVIINHKCFYKTLKNKYDYMKIGTFERWDPTTKKFSGSKKWWDKKIKDKKPEVKKFRSK
ncbi:hypothetical protein HKD37_02G005563 [Glycine soja]